MAAVVSRFTTVERVLCGHHHRPNHRWAGTIGSVAPSTAHQVTLDLIPDNSPASFLMEPPGLQLHLLVAGGRPGTHTPPIGTYEGPFFVLDADHPATPEKAEAA